MIRGPEMYEVKETKLYNEAVTLTGYGKFNLYILLATGGCLMCVIIETMCMSFIIPAAQCDLNLSLGQKGILASISFLGVVSTSHFWGFMADTKGRKNILVFCLISSSLISFACSIVPWAWLFILLRFINGSLYGVKNLSIKDDKMFLSLSYSPRAVTLKRKFGNLLVRYMRVKLENNDEFKILEKAIKRYKYNLLDEEEERPQLMGATKRKLTIEEVYSSSSSSSSEGEDDVVEQKREKKRRNKQEQLSQDQHQQHLQDQVQEIQQQRE